MRTSIPAATITLLACVALAASAQEAAPELEFEVASIKPAAPSDFDRIPMPLPIRRTCSTPDPVRFLCTHMSLRELTVAAFGIMDYQLTGPGWMSNAKFDIVAKLVFYTILAEVVHFQQVAILKTA